MHMLRRLLSVCYSLLMLASHIYVTSYSHSNNLPQTGNIITFIFKLRVTYQIVIQLLMLIQADVLSPGTTGTITQWSISAHQGVHHIAYIIQLKYTIKSVSFFHIRSLHFTSSFNCYSITT